MYLPSVYDNPLLNRLRFAMTKRETLQIAQLCSEQNVSPNTLISLCLHPNGSICFHSAWVLECMLLNDRTLLDNYLKILVDNFPNLQCKSAIRHFGKLIAEGISRVLSNSTSKKQVKQFWQMNLDPLEEICFILLTEESTKPAVKVHCMEILCLLSKRSNWIAQELPLVVRSQINTGGPAIRARGFDIIRRLEPTHK